MFRTFVPLALIGLALVPDWATAFGWRRSRHRCCATPSYAVCPVYVPATCPPVPCNGVEWAAPLAETAPPMAAPAPTPPSPTPKVHVEPATPTPAKPTESPKPPQPGIPPASNTKPAGLAVPTPADPTPTPDPKPLPVVPETVAPPKEAAPAKSAVVPTLPPLVPPVPGANDPAIPPLSIPPAPAKGKPRVAKYTPPTDTAPTVDVYPVDGAIPDPAAVRTVGFFNHTDRDLRLTVGGATVSLPPRHTITASVPARFGWRLGNGPDQTAEVPPASPGVEVVFRQ